MPARLVAVWPVVVGSPVPTVNTSLQLLEPELPYSCASKIPAPRVAAGVASTRVEAWPDPDVMYSMPEPPTLPLPASQKAEPSTVMTERGLPVLNAVVRLVEVSRLPSKSRRPTTRLTVADVVPATAARPGAAL